MTVREIADSIKTTAHQSATEYIDVLRRFFEDEFLRRMHASGFSDTLILRGGFLVWQLSDFTAIPSRNLDFLLLTEGKTDERYVYDIVDSIINTESRYELISFECEAVKMLDAVRQYRGFSLSLIGKLGNLRAGFKVNIGIGDKLFHEPEILELPPTVEGFSAIEVNSYPIESIIAEKLDILLRRFGLNDCMKHIYDIYLLSQIFDFDGYELQRAVAETFRTRENDTDYDALDRLNKLADDEYMVQLWRHFSRINNITITYNDVLARTLRFIEPIYTAIGRDGRFKLSWSGIAGRWDDNIYLY